MAVKYETYDKLTLPANSPAVMCIDIEVKPSELGTTPAEFKLAKAFPMNIIKVDYFKKAGTGTVDFTGELKIDDAVIVSDNFTDADKSYIGKVFGTGDILFSLTANSSSGDATVVFRVWYQVA